jgi:predicted ATPase
MDPNPELAKKLISNGHNLVLTGQGGTGKTYTIQSCYEQLRISGKTRAIYLLHRDCMHCRQYHSSVGGHTKKRPGQPETARRTGILFKSNVCRNYIRVYNCFK